MCRLRTKLCPNIGCSRTKLCPISFAPCLFPNLAGTLCQTVTQHQSHTVTQHHCHRFTQPLPATITKQITVFSFTIQRLILPTSHPDHPPVRHNTHLSPRPPTCHPDHPVTQTTHRSPKQPTSHPDHPPVTQTTHQSPRPPTSHPDHPPVTQTTHQSPKPPTCHPDHPPATHTTHRSPKPPTRHPDHPPSPRPPTCHPDHPPITQTTHLSACTRSACCSALMRVSAAAASSKAQLTDEVRRRNTSGSVNALPSAVDSFPIPATGTPLTGMPDRHAPQLNSYTGTPVYSTVNRYTTDRCARQVRTSTQQVRH